MAERDGGPTRTGQRVVVGVDGLAGTASVLSVAERVAAALEAQIDVVHAGSAAPPDLVDAAAAIHARLLVEPGDPVEVLAQHLARPDTLLAVVGCRGVESDARPAGHVPLGLLQHASNPVVVVPPREAGDAVERGPLHEVLVPLDAAPETTTAVGATVELISAAVDRVTVAHVFDADHVPRFVDQPHHAMQAWGQEFLARHAPTGLELVLMSGTPGTRLVDLVRDRTPDLVVLAWSRDLGLGRARTIRQLLTASPVPLLLVPVDGGQPAFVQLDDAMDVQA